MAFLSDGHSSCRLTLYNAPHTAGTGVEYKIRSVSSLTMISVHRTLQALGRSTRPKKEVLPRTVSAHHTAGAGTPSMRAAPPLMIPTACKVPAFCEMNFAFDDVFETKLC
jgi:hypothetical protein